MSLLSLQKQLVRRLKDNAFARVRPSTRGALDTYRASFHRTSKRIYQEKAEGFAKRVRIHMALDMSGSMNGRQLQAGWDAMKCVRDTFKNVADTEIYFWDDCVYHCTEDIIDAIRQKQDWNQNIEYFLSTRLQRVDKRMVTTKSIAYVAELYTKGMNLVQKMLYSNDDIRKSFWYGPAMDGVPDEQILAHTARQSGVKTDDLKIIETGHYGSTDDIVALTKIFSQCAAAPTERHIIFFFTDGSPNSQATLEGDIHNGLRTPIVADRKKWIQKNCTSQGRDVTFIPIGIDHDVTGTYGTGTKFSSSGGMEAFLRAMLKHLQYLPIFSK